MMASIFEPDFFRSAKRRLYAFVAVALAVFVIGIVAVGVVCKGYATSGSNTEKTSQSMPPQTREQATAALDSANGEMKTAASETEAALKNYEIANAELAMFLKSHFADLRAGIAPSPSEEHRQPTIDAGAKPTPRPMARKIINPRWTAMNGELDKLQTRRTELLTTMLPSHPAVLALDSSIADVQSLLQGIDKEIPDPNDAEIVNAASIDPVLSGSNQTDINSARDDALQLALAADAQRQAETQYDKLSEKAEAANQQYQAALSREQAARERQRQAESERMAALIAPQQQHGNANPRSSMGFSFLIAIIVASVIAVRTRITEQTFHTAAEVRQKLGLTVLGFLSRRSGEVAAERPRSEPRWATRSVQAAELVLASAVVCLAIYSALDHEFFHQLLTNPLAACSHKFWC